MGAALGAGVGGWTFDATGSYTWAFVSAALLGFAASGLALAIREEPIARTPTAQPAPSGVAVPAG